MRRVFHMRSFYSIGGTRNRETQKSSARFQHLSSPSGGGADDIGLTPRAESQEEIYSTSNRLDWGHAMLTRANTDAIGFNEISDMSAEPRISDASFMGTNDSGEGTSTTQTDGKSTGSHSRSRSYSMMV
jgi:hypothetical protein